MKPTPPLNGPNDVADTLANPAALPGLGGSRWPSTTVVDGVSGGGGSHHVLVAVAVGSGLIVVVLVVTLVASLAVGFTRRQRRKADGRLRHGSLLTSAAMGGEMGGDAAAASGSASAAAVAAFGGGPFNFIGASGGRWSATKNVHTIDADVHRSGSSGAWANRQDIFLLQVNTGFEANRFSTCCCSWRSITFSIGSVTLMVLLATQTAQAACS